MAKTKKANEAKQETLEPQAHAEAHKAVNEPMLPAWEQYQKPKPQAVSATAKQPTMAGFLNK